MKKLLLTLPLLALTACGVSNAPATCLAALDAAEEIFSAQAELTRADINMMDKVVPAVASGSAWDIRNLTSEVEKKADATQNVINTMERVNFEEKAAACRG